jgi:hypothetical protein
MALKGRWSWPGAAIFPVRGAVFYRRPRGSRRLRRGDGEALGRLEEVLSYPANDV